VKLELQDGQLQFWSVTGPGGCQWRRWIKAFLRSLPPNRKAAARVGHHPLHCGIAWPAVVGMRRQWTGRGFSFHPSATGHGIVALGRLRHFFVSCHSDPTVVRSQIRAPVILCGKVPQLEGPCLTGSNPLSPLGDETSLEGLETSAVHHMKASAENRKTTIPIAIRFAIRWFWVLFVLTRT
jgi:hypothetical protein